MTWRLAARYADELNLDWLTADEVCEANPVIASRCEEIGRDPATLRLSVNISRYVLQDAGASRIELLAAYREVGVNREMGLLQESAVSDEPAGIAGGRRARCGLPSASACVSSEVARHARMMSRSDDTARI